MQQILTNTFTVDKSLDKVTNANKVMFINKNQKLL